MTSEKQFNEKHTTKPTHTIRRKFWNGKRTDFETLGVAWERDGGGLYIKLHGKQIIESGFYAFPINNDTSGDGH